MNNIIAHRAMFNGQENTIKGIKYFEKLGIGVELDLRNGKNGIYMSHDPQENGELFERACKLCINSKIIMVLHIKEIEVIKNTIKILKKYSIQNYLLFNTEISNFSKTYNEYKIASYVNQKPNNPEQSILWCDETKKRWYDKEYISKLHEKNNILYAMSYEVINTKYTENEMTIEWKRLIQLEMDYICTKYPEKLMEFVRRSDLN